MKRFLFSALLLVPLAFGVLGCPSEGKSIFDKKKPLEEWGCVDHWRNCTERQPYTVTGAFIDVELVEECNAQMGDCDEVYYEQSGNYITVECQKAGNTVVIWTCTGAIPRVTNPTDNGIDTDLALSYDSGW